MLRFCLMTLLVLSVIATPVLAVGSDDDSLIFKNTHLVSNFTESSESFSLDPDGDGDSDYLWEIGAIFSCDRLIPAGLVRISVNYGGSLVGSVDAELAFDGEPYFIGSTSSYVDLALVGFPYDCLVLSNMEDDGISCVLAKNSDGSVLTDSMYWFEIDLLESSSGISSVMTGVDIFSGVLGGLFDLITGNPLFSALFGGALIMVCIPLHVELKKSAK